MPVYVGIDVHRKRSQVAVVDEGGEVLANRNVPNGGRPILSVIGGLPAGTPAAFEAAYGWGWLPGAAREFLAWATTDPGVTVSRHQALLALAERLASTRPRFPSASGAAAPASGWRPDLGALYGLERPQSPVLGPDPFLAVVVDPGEQRVQLGVTEPVPGSGPD